MSDLQFLSLSIENFKSFVGQHEFELDRQPGLYYVTGRNLTAPELGANGVGKSTLFDAILWCLWGKTGRDARPANAIQPWGKKGKTEVEICWRRGEYALYYLRRTRNPNGLFLLGECDAKREIQQEEVPGLIGMSEEMFRRTLILGQFGQLFLDLKPEAQSQMFTEALSLDIWLDAAQLAGEAEKQAKKDKDQGERDLAVCRALLESLSNQVEESSRQAKLWETDKAARIAKIEKGIKTLEIDLAGLKEVKEPQAPKNDKIEKLRAELAKEKEGAHILRLDLEATTKDIARVGARLDEFERQLKAPKKKCIECGQPISNKAFEEKMDAAVNEMEALAKVASDHQVEARAQKARVDRLAEDLDTEQRKYRAAEEKYSDALEAWQGYQATLKANQAELQRQRSALQAEQASKNIFEQSAQVNKDRRAAKRAEKTEIERKLEGLGAKIEEAGFWADAYREIRLGVIDEALIELEMASSRHAAMLGLNDWGIRFETERETNAGKVSYGFTVMLYPPGEDQPVKWESYSGGESQRWQLAVSFALSEVLLARAGLSPNMEILDEPTRGLSSDGVADLLDHLRDRAMELGRAIFFVDHHSLDKGDFDGVLQITKDKKGSSAKWL